MYALTIDQRDSRARPDLVPQLLARLASVEVALPFERTAGDEVQGLLLNPEAVVVAIEHALRSKEWSIGLGIGPIEQPLPGSVREARGVALLRARDAVEAAKRVPSVPVRVLSEGQTDRTVEVEALIRLAGTVLQRRTPAQWRVIDAVRENPDRGAAAAELGITVQAVSKSLITSGEDVVRGVYPLLARLLLVADEGSGP